LLDFKYIKSKVNTREAAEFYGLHVRPNGMTCCPFHDDKEPSMKVDKIFYCFGCQEKGDVITFVEKLFKCSTKDAALKISSDFGLDANCLHQTRTEFFRAKRRVNENRQFERAIERTFNAYCVYLHNLNNWEEAYSPKTPTEELNPLWLESIRNKDYVNELLDILIYGSDQEKAEVLIAKAEEVMRIESRFN